MIFGWITREQYLEHHDPARWPIKEPPSEAGPSKSKTVPA
jgi:hypothetical protein